MKTPIAGARMFFEIETICPFFLFSAEESDQDQRGSHRIDNTRWQKQMKRLHNIPTLSPRIQGRQSADRLRC